MSPAAALLTGLTMAFGLVLLGSGAPGRRAPRLLTRLDPYLRGLEPRSTQLLETEEAPLVPVPMLDRLLRPILDEGGQLVERCLGGATGVARRLREAGLAENVPRFRAEQMLWGLVGLAAASAVGLIVPVVSGGVPVVAALERLAARVPVPQVVRFVDGLVVAVERGTPLADVLRAQATDVREQHKRELIEAGGRREVYMLVPVVFLLMPVVVLFALYPGFLTLSEIAR